MPKTVSVTEAQSKLSSLVQWANQAQDGVVVERRGRPAAAIISYADFEELLRLRKLEQKRQALKALRELRQRVQARVQATGLTAEAAYRQAGFGEEVIQDTLAKDKALAES
jgi:prevent-host-death family protein